jgi:acyl transferase domain-containing protein
VEDKIYCKKGGFLGSHFAFNPLKYGTMPRTVEGAEPDQFLVLRTVVEAMEDAGYLHKRIDGTRVSIILGRGNYLGAGLSALLQRGLITQQTLDIIKGLHPEFTQEHLDEIKAALRRSLPEFGPETAPGLIPNITTGRVANRLDFMGKNFTVDAACASSLIASELGIQGLVSGQDDVVLAGGVHVFTNVPFLQVFAAMRALSPTSSIRPFDEHCDGTMPGEGVGIIVLKRLEDAEEAGDRIYAVIKGTGSSSDGKAKSVTAPRVHGEELAVRRAYDSSGIPPETIQLIEAHGTGTPVGDAAEIETLHRVFGSRIGGPPTVAVGSVKSMIGHAMPAAGAAGIIKTALALYHRVLPPTLNCRKPVAQLVHADSRFYVNTEVRPWIRSPMAEPRRAGINAFGFGGVNAHMILEEYKGGDPDKWRTLIRTWESELIVIEAETREKLQATVAKLRQYVVNAPWVQLRDLAYTQNTNLRKLPFRVSIVAASLADLDKKLQLVEQRLRDASCKQIKDTAGIYYFHDSPLRDGKVAVLFPGEGSHYLNMLSDLCIHFPEVRERFDLADEMVEDQNDRYPPSADIFPPPFFSKEEKRAAERRQMQRSIEAVLTADGAVSTLLKNLGLKADMMAGHSAGEWIALAASGILDVGEFLGSLNRLGHMYRALAEDPSIPRMVMMAVGAGSKRVEEIIAGIDCTVHIANDNCPNQVVIVVEPKYAERVLAEIQSRGVFVEKLAYDRGYHTTAFTYICEPLREYFSEMAIRPPHTPVFCCTTGQQYPNDPKQILDHVANTFARPLLFRQTIEAMYEAGARIFVEAGPRGNLTAFVDDVLRGRPHLAVAIDQYRRPPLTTLNNALGLLAALHVPIDLAPLYIRRSPRLLTGDPNKDRIEVPDSAPGTMQVPLGSPRLEAPPPLPAVTVNQPEAPMTLPAPAYSGEIFNSEFVDDLSIPDFERTGAMDSHFHLMESFLETQEAVMKAFLQSGGMDTERTAVEDLNTPMVAVETAGPAVTLAPSAAAAAVVSPAVAGTATVNVADALLRIVSDRTGYPLEMLGLDLDMEADLGIDSIKRVEILSALQQEGGGQVVGETAMEDVARLKTLRQVLEFLKTVGAVYDQSSLKTVGAVYDRALLPEASIQPRSTTAPRVLTAQGTIASHTPGEEVTIVCKIDPEEHLYLADHCFDPVGSESDLDRNGLYFVPLTVSLAIMTEVAAVLNPGLRVVGARNVQAAKWIDVEKGGPRVTIAISAKRTGDQKASVRIIPYSPDRKSAVADVLAEATVLFAPEYPEAPEAEELDLVNPKKPDCTGPELYTKRRMFHGPSFQGIVSLDAMAENGLLAKIDTLPRNSVLRSDSSPVFHVDPFLLDAAGQLVGYWPIEYCNEGFVLFPIRIEELTLYREPLAPGERSVCQMRIRNLSPRQLKANLDLVHQDGRVWMRVSGWEDWRFYWPREFYEFWRYPNKGENGRPVAIRPPGKFSDVVCRWVEPFGEIDKNMWENLWAHIILSRRELDEYRSIGGKSARAKWICERAVIKDAVRAWMRGRHRRDVFPADVEVTVENNQPNIAGNWPEGVPEPLYVSMANDGPVTVAAAGSCRLGLEIESIIHWEVGFEGAALPQRERILVASNEGTDRDEWLTRLWCAKKGAAKVLGVAAGDIASVKIEKIDMQTGEVEVRVGNDSLIVSTVRDGNYIIALAAREAHDRS